MTPPSFSGHTGAALAVILLIAWSAVVVFPVSAATQYLGGSPAFTASVAGVNEFVPGQDATITLLVKNNGLNAMKQLDKGTIEAEDLPTTAKFVTIGLTSDADAILIKTDPQMFGAIPAGGTGVPVQIQLKISANATDGEYQLPLMISYKYLRVIPQEQADVYEYTYTTAKDTVPVTIRIKPEVKIEVIEVVADSLSAGTEGYLSLKIRNAGPENGTMASVKLARSGSSAVIPTDATVYIGDFPSGGIVDCRYKIAASNNAINQTYPVDVLVSYTNREGAVVTSKPETIGVPVNAKTRFTIISTVPSVTAGSTSTIEVRYRNDGSSTAYATQSQISPHGSVTIDDNMAYLGDIPPGESGTARYEVRADGAADPKEYTFDSTLRYRDTFGNSQESETIGVTLQILPANTGTVAGIPILTVAIGIILVVIAAGIGLLAYQRRMRR
jgi:hypothetical protein